MKAGRLKYKLELFKPDTQLSGTGNKRTTYVSQGVVWAERVRMTGNRQVEVGEQFSDYRTVWNIRDAHPIDAGWRVTQLGGHTYTVMDVIPNIDRGYNRLDCERVNE